MSKLLIQYNQLKKEDSSYIYLFRVGIFYNILNDDAKFINKNLGLKITTLSPDIIKCGFPISKIEKYKKCLTSTNSPDILYDCCGERKQHGFLKRNSKK